VALAFAAWGSLDASPSIWLVGVALLFASACLFPAATHGPTLLSAAVLGFAAWLVATNAWFNPSYSAAAPYHAAFLLGGFVLGRRAGVLDAWTMFLPALLLVLCLGAWALLQEATTQAQRAHALFETPATLAATLNLVLVPSVLLLAFGRSQSLLVPCVTALAAAWVAAGSLGGWLAATLGASVAAGFAYRAGLRARTRDLLLAASALALGWLVAQLVPVLWTATGGFGSALSGVASSASAVPVHEPLQSGAARLDLYQLALGALPAASWLTGYGYLGFYHLLEAGREAVRSYGPGTTYFVHNDYLQMLLELGIPGLALFLGIVTLPLLHARRAIVRIPEAQRVVIVALVGAAATMIVHALVDFPFYVPVCVALYGIVIGVIDSTARGAVTPGHPMHRASLAALVTIGAVLLVKPAAAEAAAANAQRQWRVAQAERAAWWFEVARRIEPRDWRYHWYAGQFWYAQARAGNPAGAALADQAFAAGFAANSREVRNLAGRILTHRNLRGSLATPADDATLRAWTETVARLAPNDAKALK
jgi:O-antigen ligase